MKTTKTTAAPADKPPLKTTAQPPENPASLVQPPENPDPNSNPNPPPGENPPTGEITGNPTEEEGAETARLAKAKEKLKPDNAKPPTMKQVVAAGYEPAPAAAIVARERARYDALLAEPEVTTERLQEILSKASQPAEATVRDILTIYEAETALEAQAATQRPALPASGKAFPDFDRIKPLAMCRLMRWQMELIVKLTGHVTNEGEVAEWFAALDQSEKAAREHEALTAE